MDPIAAALRTAVDAGEIAGAATLVWRSGDARVACAGWRDLDAGLPVERDTLFRIASMTKPVTSTAALMLWEEGRFALDEPITRWAPELSRMRVLRSPDGPLDETVPADRPITFEDLLTHRAGLTYAGFHDGPLARAYEALGGDIDSPVAPDAWIAALGAVPLLDQPGAAFRYGRATDLLGLLLARMEDAPLGDVLQRRIFDPLGMKDTAFVARDAGRCSRAYGFDDAGRRVALETCPGGSTVRERPADMAFVSGGQGLWSTVDDFLAFARVFVGAGTVDGVRLLRPETLVRMTTNQLTPAQRATADVGGFPVFAAGHGFGLGVAVVVEPDRAAPTICRGGIGTVGWPGAFGGWWQADPTDGSVAIFLTHHMVERDQFAQGIGLEIYGLLTRFHALVRAS